MKKMGLVATLVAGLLFPVGCGSSGGDGGLSILEQLQGCTEDGLGYLMALTLIMEPVIEAIADDRDVPGLSVTETDETEHIWSYTYVLDLDGDGVPETTLAGTIDFSADPDGGIQPGTSSVIGWNVGGTEGFAGNGTFNTNYGEDEMTTLSGSGTLMIPGGCELNITIPVGTPLNIAPNGIAPMLDLLGAEVYGAIQLIVSRGGDNLSSTLTLLMGSNTVQASNVMLNGIGGVNFEFDVELDEERLQAMFGCVEGSFFLLEQVFEMAGDVVAAVAFGDEFEGTLNSSPTGQLGQWTFSASRNGEEIEGTLTVSLGIGTATGNLVFEYSDEGGLLQASSTAGNPLTFAGTLVGEEISDVAVYGRVFTQFPLLGPVQAQQPNFCYGTITIPSTNPVSGDFFGENEEDGLNEGARINFDVDLNGDNLKLFLGAVEDDENEGEYFLGILGALFNNFPLPASFVGS